MWRWRGLQNLCTFCLWHDVGIFACILGVNLDTCSDILWVCPMEYVPLSAPFTVLSIFFTVSYQIRGTCEKIESVFLLKDQGPDPPPKNMIPQARTPYTRSHRSTRILTAAPRKDISPYKYSKRPRRTPITFTSRYGTAKNLAERTYFWEDTEGK